jgi:hypothetical protein
MQLSLFEHIGTRMWGGIYIRVRYWTGYWELVGYVKTTYPSVYEYPDRGEEYGY